MYVCICRAVTRTDVEATIEEGARTVAQVGERCAAGTDCGRCQRTIIRLLEARAPQGEVSQPWWKKFAPATGEMSRGQGGAI